MSSAEKCILWKFLKDVWDKIFAGLKIDPKHGRFHAVSGVTPQKVFHPYTRVQHV
jgi:hypothetical protein